MQTTATQGAVSARPLAPVQANVASTAGSAPAKPAAPVDTMERVASASKGIQRGPQDLNGWLAKQAIARAQDELAARGFVSTGPSQIDTVPVSVEVDELNQVHVRLNRVVDGMPVFGDQVIVHLRNGLQGKDVLVTGKPLPVTRPVGATLRTASTHALSAVVERRASDLPADTTVERVAYVDPNGRLQAGFLVVATDLEAERPSKMTYLVNGETGAIDEEWDALPTLRAWSTVEDAAPAPQKAKAARGTATEPARDDQTLYSGVVALQTRELQNGRHVMIDDSRGQGIETRDAKNAWSGSGAKVYEDDNGKWGEASDSERQVAAVDAAYGAASTWDMYKELFGRDSIDGKGEKLISNVHIRRNYVNAFWDGRTMNYGDGDGRTASHLTTLDIAGHEITHGLTQRTANLVYSGESGGLNESYSDVGGFLVEWLQAQKNPDQKWDWLMGEDAWTPGNGNDDALRYMDDPTKDNYSIDHYSQYPRQREVHGSSGIANNAFYQLAEPNNEGKKANSVSKQFVKDGIGIEKAAKIWFRALIHYMTPRTTFAEARAATIRAAEDLFGAGSVEAQKTAEAWSVVGVGTDDVA